jgi:pentatricopeptide repeat protein
MVEDSVKPNPVTFLIILSACNRMGLFNKSQMYLETMSKDYGIVPDAEHLTWVVDLLCRSGQFGEALAMVKKMPSAPGCVVWHTLMDACRSSGNVRIGKQAFEHAITLDGGDAAAYVLLCHMYADSGSC